MSNDPFTLDMFGSSALSSGLGLGVTAFGGFAPEAANDDDPDPMPPTPAPAMRLVGPSEPVVRKRGDRANFYFEEGEDRGLAASWKERARLNVAAILSANELEKLAITEARDATAKSAADARDEDLDGPVGYDSAAQRKREFAADMGIQAHALRMAAEGAVAAYEQIVGEQWKPFDRPVDNPSQTLDRKAAEAQMDALG